MHRVGKSGCSQIPVDIANVREPTRLGRTAPVGQLQWGGPMCRHPVHKSQIGDSQSAKKERISGKQERQSRNRSSRRKGK